MGIFSYEYEISSSIPPSKLFRAIVLEPSSVFPKIFPQLFSASSFITVEGDGGPGTIKQINSLDGTYVKERVDAIDKEKYAFAYSVIEGVGLANKYEKISYDFKFEATSDGGSICKGDTKYYTVANSEVNSHEIEGRKENTLGMFRAIEAYLLANPNALD